MDQRLARAIEFAKAAYAVPEIKAGIDSVIQISGASTAFWICSMVAGRLALWLHDALDDSLAVLFAVAYNLVLGVLFSAVIAMTVAFSGKAGAIYKWYEVAGFLIVYVMMRVVYGDRHGKVDEYGLLGYLGGIGAYIFLLLRPKYLVNPYATRTYDVVVWVMQGWIPRVLTALGFMRALFGFTNKIARAVTRWIYYRPAVADEPARPWPSRRRI